MSANVMNDPKNAHAYNKVRMCYRVAFVIFLVIAIDGCHTNRDNLIVAGKRVGDCVLLKTRSNGANTPNELGCGIYSASEGDLNGLDFSFDARSGLLIGIGVTDSRHQTRDGIHVGDDINKVINAEGPGTPVAAIYHYYKSQPSSDKPVLAVGYMTARRYPGIIFALNKQGRVGGIWIGTEDNLSAISCPVNPTTYSLLPSSRDECHPDKPTTASPKL